PRGRAAIELPATSSPLAQGDLRPEGKGRVLTAWLSDSPSVEASGGSDGQVSSSDQGSPIQFRTSKIPNGWPWLVLALTVIPAIWHVVDFEEDVDPEFPQVVRPTFSVVPPAAYRLAEPGDTLDRVALYLASASLVLAAYGLVLTRGGGLW